MRKATGFSHFVCPSCFGPLESKSQQFVCTACPRMFSVVAGVPELVAGPSHVEPSLVEEAGAGPEELFHQVNAARSAVERDRVPHRTLLDRWLPSEGTFAELGCGTAFVSGFYRSPKRRFLALDLDRSMLAQVSRAYPDVEVAACDARSLPLKREAVDGVVALGIFELDGARGAVGVREAARVLKPGGFLYASITYTNLLRRFGVGPRWRGNSITTFTKDEVQSLMQANGFEIQLLRECAFAHWLGPFRRVAGLFPSVLAAEHDTALAYRALRPALAQVANTLVVVARKRGEVAVRQEAAPKEGDRASVRDECSPLPSTLI